MKPVVPKEILNQHVAVLGKTRSGKSSVMRGLVEGLLRDQKPVCIIDPKGDWYGLKLSADGKSPGFPVVIFGGSHADVPIDEHSGTAVAELFATGNRPCLIDMGGWTVGARTRFWIAFASTLFRETKGHRWLVIDEVHNFAPKGSLKGSGDDNMATSLHWVNRFASEGLGKGVAMLFASQRPQKVHNDTLTSAETLIAMRVLHPSDRGAIADWIAGNGDASGTEVLASLARMKRGEGWAWSPEIGFGPKLVQFPMFETYDSFRPQTVEDTKRLKGWASVDLDEVRAKLKSVIEKAKADDPVALRKALAEEKKAAAARVAALDKRVVELTRQVEGLSAVKPVSSTTTAAHAQVAALTAELRRLRAVVKKAQVFVAAVSSGPQFAGLTKVMEWFDTLRDHAAMAARFGADVQKKADVLGEELARAAAAPVAEEPPVPAPVAPASPARPRATVPARAAAWVPPTDTATAAARAELVDGETFMLDKQGQLKAMAVALLTALATYQRPLQLQMWLALASYTRTGDTSKMIGEFVALSDRSEKIFYSFWLERVLLHNSSLQFLIKKNIG